MSGTLYDKVVQGLAGCIATNGSNCPVECPYINICFAREGTQDVYVHLFADALALIRQQQERIAELEAARTARVMTLEETRALPLGAVAWREDRWTDEDGAIRTDLFPVMRSVCCGTPVLADGESQEPLESVGLCPEEDECPIRERYWTQRPTDEEREAIPWA